MLVCSWKWTSGFNQDTFYSPVGLYLCFLWKKHEEKPKMLSQKEKKCHCYEWKHPHAWLSGVSICHLRAWHWDPWPIREAGLWKSRNLGIGFWQSVCCPCSCLGDRKGFFYWGERSACTYSVSTACMQRAGGQFSQLVSQVATVMALKWPACSNTQHKASSCSLSKQAEIAGQQI